MISNTAHATSWKATDFALQGTDGKIYSLAEVRGPKGTLMVFICNHCPYVKGYDDPNKGASRCRE